MKKVFITMTVVVFVLTASVRVYAYYGNRGGGMYGPQSGMYGPQGRMGFADPQGGMQFNGPRGGMYGRGGRMYGPGMMQQGRGAGNTWNATCPCGGGYDRWNNAQSGQNVPGQPGTAPQIMTEEKAKETAEAYIVQYLPGYSVENVEKDNWRPLYLITVKNESGAELQMLVHGFDGQVMHLFPKPAEQSAE